MEEQKNPQAGEIWWIRRADGHEAQVLVIGNQDKCYITTKVLATSPRKYGIVIGEGIWAVPTMVGYALKDRFVEYNKRIDPVYHDRVLRSLLNMILPDGAGSPAEAEKLRAEVERLKTEQEGSRAVADAVIVALREENDKLKKDAENREEHDSWTAELTVTAAQLTAERDALDRVNERLIEALVRRLGEAPPPVTAAEKLGIEDDGK